MSDQPIVARWRQPRAVDLGPARIVMLAGVGVVGTTAAAMGTAGLPVRIGWRRHGVYRTMMVKLHPLPATGIVAAAVGAAVVIVRTAR